MILEYCSEQCFILKKKIMSTLVRHKECVSGFHLGSTQNVSRPLLFYVLESLENLPNICILHSSSVMLMTTATILLAVEVKQCLLQIILTTGLFREPSAQKLQRIHYLPFPVLLSTTVVQYIMLLSVKYYNC